MIDDELEEGRIGRHLVHRRVERNRARRDGYHHLGPAGQPRNVMAMSNEKLRHLVGHPCSTDELRRMTRRELRERGLRVPAVRMSEARWHDAEYLGLESWEKGDRGAYETVIAHHRREAKRHERAARMTEDLDRHIHHLNRAAHHRMRAKQYSRDLRHAQARGMPGVRDRDAEEVEAGIWSGMHQAYSIGSDERMGDLETELRRHRAKGLSELHPKIKGLKRRIRASMPEFDFEHDDPVVFGEARLPTEHELEEAFVEGYAEDLLERAADDAYYRARAESYGDQYHGGIGTSKRMDIGHGKGRKYPPGLQAIRNALIRKGMDVGKATAIAYGALRRWAEGRGKVKPSTRDKARKVLAQLDADKGKGKARAVARRA